VGVSPKHGVSLCFVSLPALRMFGYYYKQRVMQEVSLLALHLPKSHTKAIMRVPQIVTYAVREKEWKTKENKAELW